METIPFARPWTGKEEEEAVLRVLRSGWLTTGREALAFEAEFSAFLMERAAPGEPEIQALAVNSATSGLHLALEALGIGPGDAVFLPSYTFTATAEVVRYLGAEAVFVDLEGDSYNIGPAGLEQALSRALGPGIRPRAVIPVHFGGLPCDMGAIKDLARRYGLAVVEDAAHAFPAPLPGKDSPWAGTGGDAGVFSFYATKTITTGEGGMVVTRRKDLAERVSLMRSHGIDRSIWNRYTDPKAPWYYEVVAPGYKYNLPDLLAALGRVQLSRAMELLKMRESIAARYDGALKNHGAVILPPPGGARHLYTLRFRNPADRDPCMEYLRNKGIGTSVHFIPLHIMPYYKERYGLKAEEYPESLKRFRETLSLPIWPGMSEAQVDRVIGAVREAPAACGTGGFSA
ncbi:MAG: DegT/DnrJ/EryC1/StrS aminotransferase family protein [Spirochaetaceae bacterium]|jgi:dTDP-4-amino-4,6-dideoxygalactose transaminase|nr:DegT/DnrJ/EryC1/StrS aminotransferase family protein [Spirochaetaceae bacterium]